MMYCLIKLELATLTFTGFILALGASESDLRIAIGALAGAIVVLFGIVMAAYRNIQKKFDQTFEQLMDCENDRNELRKNCGLPPFKKK